MSGAVLASWNERNAKEAIVGFVNSATTPGAGFVADLGHCRRRRKARGEQWGPCRVRGHRSRDPIDCIVLLGPAERPMAAEPASKGGGIPLALRLRDVP